MARGVPVACSRPLVAARGRRRRRAAVRPGRPARDRRRDRAAARRPGARPSACARPGAQRAARFTWERTARADARELRARAVARSSRRPRRASASSDSRRALRANQSRGRARAAPRPPSCTRTIAAARSSGAARRGDEAVDAVLDQLGRGVVRVAHDDARRAARGRLDDDQPVALAARRQHHAERARAASRSTSLGVDEARAPRRRRSSPCAAIAASTAARSGPSPKIAPRSSGTARARSARSPARRAGARFSGMWRPANTTTRLGRRAARRRRASPAYSPSSTVDLAAQRPRRAAAPRCRRAKQNARWRHAQAQRAARRQPTRAADAAEVLAPVRARPDLVPVDDERGSGAARRSQRRRRAARSTGTRRCGRRRSGGRGAAGARARRRRTRAAAAIRRLPSARVERHPRPGRDDAHAGAVAALAAAVPLAQRQVGDLVARRPPAARRGCGTSARRRRRCTGTGSRRRGRCACGGRLASARSATLRAARAARDVSRRAPDVRLADEHSAADSPPTRRATPSDDARSSRS